MFLKLNLFVISYDAKVKRLMYLLCYHEVKISPFLFIFHHFTYIRKSLYYSVF